MNISVLMENRASAGFASEHGLSLYIETGGQRILFDAGESGAFADNAARMNVDLSAVAFAVLSHAHHDHSGGMLRFLELNRDAPVYVSRYAHLPCSNAAGKPLSADPALFRSGRTVAVGERMHPAPGMTLCSCNRRRRPFPAETYGQTLQLRHGTVPDDYRHEQYLLICDGSRTVLFSGCSHKGIFNLLHWFHPDILVGGFHFMKRDTETPTGRRALLEDAQRLASFPTHYLTGHCTGEEQAALLKQILKDRLICFHAGDQLDI